MIHMTMDEVVSRIVASLDYEQVSRRIEQFLLENLESSGRAGYVLGMSGGLDSSVVAALTARALRKGRYSLTALIIPHSSITPSTDVQDAIRLARDLDIRYRVIEVEDIHSSLVEILQAEVDHSIGSSTSSNTGSSSERIRIASGNLLARLRMCILYYYANTNDFLVLGTSDKSELMIGYYTKYGDGAADLLPIADLYKVQVRALAVHLGIDDVIVRKRSSPMLWKGHYAEQELGMSYEEIDSILYCLLDLKCSTRDTVKILGIDEERVKSVIRLMRRSRHKRALPMLCHVNHLTSRTRPPDSQTYSGA